MTENKAVEGKKCVLCGMKLSSWAEYHPFAFCLLVKGGIDPWALVEKAHKRRIELEALTQGEGND